MPSVAGPCPPFGVHPFGSHVRVSGNPVSSRPVSGHLFRRPGSGCPADWCPPVRRPAGWCPPVRPVTSVSSAEARRWHWDHIGAAGNPHHPERIEFHVVCGVPSGWVDGPSRPRRGRPGGGGGEAGGGASVVDLAGSGLGAGCGRARPLTGQGRPARREGRPSVTAEPGMGARVQARGSCTWAWLPSWPGA
jgi:hypothetical protein